MAASGDNVTGPVLAIARRPEGPLTLFDGVHRLAAWDVHLNAGRDYSVNVSVAVTADVASKWELSD